MRTQLAEARRQRALVVQRGQLDVVLRLEQPVAVTLLDHADRTSEVQADVVFFVHVRQQRERPAQQQTYRVVIFSGVGLRSRARCRGRQRARSRHTRAARHACTYRTCSFFSFGLPPNRVTRPAARARHARTHTPATTPD